MPEDGDKKREVGKFFGGLAAPGFGLEDEFFSYMGELLVQYANIAPNSTVLDVATGRGAIVFPAGKSVGEFGRAVGIDIADDMILQTSKTILRRKIPNVTVRIMDAENLDFENASFNAALCGFALFFFPNLSRAILEIARVLKPGGIFAASVFAPQGYPWVWYGDLLRESGITKRQDNLVSLISQNISTRRRLSEVVRDGGFVRVKVKEITYRQDFMSKDKWWESVLNSSDAALFATIEESQVESFRKSAFSELDKHFGKGFYRFQYQALLVKAYKSLS